MSVFFYRKQIVVARIIYMSQLFISRMPKMCAIPQLVSAPFNSIPIVEHFSRSHPQSITRIQGARVEKQSKENCKWVK